MVRQFATETSTLLTILRPGIVYGKDRLWNASLGVNVKNRLWVCVGDRATLPLLYVENCADAIMQAILYPPKSRHTINLVDDNLPTQKMYRDALHQVMFNLPAKVMLPWAVVNQMSRLASQLPGISRTNLPGLLIPPGAVEPLVQRLKQLLDDADLRQRIGQSGRIKVQQEFNLAQEVPWLKQIMDADLSGRTEAIRPQMPFRRES